MWIRERNRNKNENRKRRQENEIKIKKDVEGRFGYQCIMHLPDNSGLPRSLQAGILETRPQPMH